MKTKDTVDITPEAQELIKEAEGIVAEYRTYTIVDNAQYSSAGDALKRIKTKAAELEELRKSMTKPLDESKKRIMDFFRKPLDFLAQAESIIKRSMLGFQQAEERKRLEAERKAKELADKEAEKLRKKAEKEAAKGNTAKAEELKQQAEETAAITPVVASTVEEVKGVSTKKIWKYRIVDANVIPREYMIPNEKMLGDVARATKGQLPISGVEFYSEDIISAGK